MSTGNPSGAGAGGTSLIESVTFKADGIEDVLAELEKLRQESEKLARTQGKAKEALQAYGDYAEGIRRAGKELAKFNQENQHYGDNQRYQRYDQFQFGGSGSGAASRGSPFSMPNTSNRTNALTEHFNRNLNQHEQDRLAEANAKAKARADRVAEVRARVEDRQRQSISAGERLGDNDMNRQAVQMASADLKKFKRELSDGTFRQAAVEAEKLRAATVGLMRQQAALAREARKQELEARYGRNVGAMAYRAERLQPKLSAGISAAAELGRWGNSRAQAGMHGTVVGENLAANEIAFNRKLADAQQGVNQVKARLFKIGAKILGEQGGQGQDALGWGMFAAQNAPEGAGRGLAQVGATGLSMVPGLGAGALRLGGMAARFGASALGTLGGALGVGAFAAWNAGHQADRQIDRDEAAGKGDWKALGLKGDEFGYRAKFDAIKDPNERAKAIREEQTKLTREQSKDTYQPGFHRTVVDTINNATSWGGKSLLSGLGMGFGNQGIDMFLNGRNAKKDDLQERQAILQGINKPMDKEGKGGNGNRSSPIAAGGFESLDETYMRQENAFSRLSGAEAGAAARGDQGALTGAINKLVDWLEKFTGVGGGKNDGVQRHA